jgi:hypothetical protein
MAVFFIAIPVTLLLGAGIVLLVRKPHRKSASPLGRVGS